MRLITERLALINRQLDHARHELDRLVHQLAYCSSFGLRPVAVKHPLGYHAVMTGFNEPPHGAASAPA